MMRSDHLAFRNVRLKGKYSFQYIHDATFDGCTFDTKDAFWHAKDVVVRNSTVKGEYLAWYCENVTFEHCKIIGTQPLCYCKGLRLVDCEMIDTDLSFEKSQVEATITTPVISIKNPRTGRGRTHPRRPPRPGGGGDPRPLPLVAITLDPYGPCRAGNVPNIENGPVAKTN